MASGVIRGFVKHSRICGGRKLRHMLASVSEYLPRIGGVLNCGMRCTQMREGRASLTVDEFSAFVLHFELCVGRRAGGLEWCWVVKSSSSSTVRSFAEFRTSIASLWCAKPMWY
jgi:hypothetical protein